MSALPSSGPLARDLFDKSGSAFNGFEYAHKESRNSYDISSNKKRRAPQPPGAGGLSQYKPKILGADSTGHVPVNQNVPPADSPVRPPRPSKSQGSNPSTNRDDAGGVKAMVMGDKDVPMVLHSPQDTDDSELDVANLALIPAGDLDADQDLGTQNPLFSMQSEDGDAQQHNLDLHVEDKDESLETAEPDGVYIPAPDYEEEEKVMTFPEEEDEDYPTDTHPRKQVYKEYDGEDFAQYLSDEENGQADAQAHQNRHSLLADKAKTEVKRPPKKREPLPSKNKKGVAGTSSLRNFSFADSKFGTVAGNKKHKSLPHLSEDTKEAELFVNTGASYEQFLRQKNGEDFGYMVSDSGYTQEVGGHPEAPSVHSRPVGSKDTMWKRLTWKFKKQMKNSFDVTASS